MEEYQLSPKQIASLKSLHRTFRDRKKADRVKAVALLGTGYPVAQVAEILFLDETTVRTYYEKYVQGGEEGLLTECHCKSLKSFYHESLRDCICLSFVRGIFIRG